MIEMRILVEIREEYVRQEGGQTGVEEVRINHEDLL